jgi:hypothetical protein
VFPLDEGWVIIRAREDPKAILREVGNILSPEAIRVQRDLVNYLTLDEDVDRVISVVPDIIEPFNRMFHYAEPKYRTIPTTIDDAYGLFTLFMMGTAPGEADVWLSLANNDACMRVLTSISCSWAVSPGFTRPPTMSFMRLISSTSLSCSR